jgi:hypothetical protein
MKNKNLIIVVLLLVVVAVGSFLAGRKFSSDRRTFGTGQFGARQPGMPFGQGNQGQGNRGSFRPISGEIISVDDKSITVKIADGSSKIVILTDKTEINQASKATVDDLKVGGQVMAMGQENTDGSITAQNIQLNPRFGGNQLVTP